MDLTIDSDLDNGDDEVEFLHAATVTSKPTHVTSSPALRPSNASTSTTQPITAPSPSLSTINIPLEHALATQSNAARPTFGTTTSTGSNKPSTTAASTGVVRNWSIATSPIATLLSCSNGSHGPDRSAKRRKLSAPGEQAAIQDGAARQRSVHISGQQPSGQDGTVSTWSQSVKHSSVPSSLGNKLNTMNQVPSVHYMNSALKPTGSHIPFLDNDFVETPRPLSFGRLAQVETATGRPSSGLTTPGSVSLIDSDLAFDRRDKQTPVPVMDEALRHTWQVRQDNKKAQSKVRTPDAYQHVPSTQAEQTAQFPAPSPALPNQNCENRLRKPPPLLDALHEAKAG